MQSDLARNPSVLHNPRQVGLTVPAHTPVQCETSYTGVRHSSCFSHTRQYSATAAKLQFQQGCGMSGNPGQTGRAQSSFPFINNISGQIRYMVAHTDSYRAQITNDHHVKKGALGNPALMALMYFFGPSKPTCTVLHFAQMARFSEWLSCLLA